MSTIKAMQLDAYENSAAHGFWDACPDAAVDPIAYGIYLGNKLMLIVGEVSEAHEELRSYEPTLTYYREDGKPEGLPFELADIVIRVADLAEHLGLDLGGLISEKATYNAGRPHLHGKAF